MLKVRALAVIVRNEFMDHVTNNVFLMSFAIFFTTMVCSTYYQLVVFQKNMVLLEYYGMLGENIWMELNSGVVGRMISILSTVGALVAVSISFNSFEKGRVEGSLRVLLSYPVYRDTIILGKILAGVLVLFIVTLTSMSVSFTLFLFYCNVPLSLDLFLRFFSVVLMGVVLLSFYLSLGILSSLLGKDASTNLLVVLLTIMIIQPETIRQSIVAIGNILSSFDLVHVHSIDLIFIPDVFYHMALDNDFLRIYGRISPAESYRLFSLNMFSYPSSLVTSYFDLFSEYAPAELFSTLITQNIDLIAIQVFYLLIVFSSCYALFTRRDLS